jgi:hypothetical protein
VLTRLSLLVVGAALALLALTPATGHAAALKYHACDGKKYLLLDQHGDPLVKLLRIKMRKAKVDDYAPRCLVAEAVAMQVQQGASGGKTPPKHITVYGARWGIGKVTCSYTAMSGYTQAQCVKTGKNASTTRFRLVPNARRR